MNIRSSTVRVIAAVLFALPLLAQSPVIRGRVVDATTGEPLSKALVSVRELGIEVQTDEAGPFEITTAPAGEIELYVSTVGYGLVKRKIELQSGIPAELDVTRMRF
jgi:iron complex outermembrane recepter protein